MKTDHANKIAQGSSAAAGPTVHYREAARPQETRACMVPHMETLLLAADRGLSTRSVFEP